MLATAQTTGQGLNVSARPAVLDDGSDAKKYITQRGTLTRDGGVTIAYELLQAEPASTTQVALQVDAAGGPDASGTRDAASNSTSGATNRILMIMGFAATGEAWLPTIKDLFARGSKSAGLEVAVFDNRGIGASSSPADKRAYTTSIMAGDALAVMDALGWSRAHIVGHSMGSMIACRLALEAPQRVASLTLISATGGGSEAIPTNCTAFAAGMRGAIKTDPLSRADVDLAFHFSKRLLKQMDPVSGRTVKHELLDQYVAMHKATGGQSKAGQDGHMNAVMSHHLTKQEYARLRSAGFPILVIHGAEDILAAPRHAAALARRLGAPLVMIDHSAHFTPRDAAAEVTDELLATIEAVRRGATHADAVHPCPNPAAYERSTCAALLCCCFA